MTPFSAAEIDLVRTSFAQVARAPEALAADFYRRLFELDRSLRHLFHGDMRRLGEKFTATLGVLVNNLERFEDYLPSIRALGARHAGYQVRDEHYAVVGVALIGTLATHLGETFTADTRAAWTHVYGTIASEMIAGARASGAAPLAPTGS